MTPASERTPSDDVGDVRARDERLIIFDFDGTLADTWRDIATALNRTLADADLGPVTGPEVRSWIGHGAFDLLRSALPANERSGERLESHFERFRHHYDRCCLDTTELYPGIAACLDELSGERLTVLSNKPARFLDRIAEGLALKGRFELILGGDALEARKPDPAVIHQLVARLRTRPDRVFVIGDSGVDVQCGRDYGATTIGCGWGLRGREELREAGVNWLVEHPREIAQIVLGRAS